MLCCRVSRCCFTQLWTHEPLRRMNTYRKIKPGKVLGRKTIRERINGPAADGVNVRRHLILAGSSLLGLGMLCWTGQKISGNNINGEENGLWPNIVRDRIQRTYQHVATAVVTVSTGAVALTQLAHFKQFLAANKYNKYLVLLGTVSTVIVTGAIILDLPADSDIFGIKHAVWLCQCATVAIAVAAVRNVIALSTLGSIASMIAGLSAVSTCAPSERFLNLGGPLAMGLSSVFVSSLRPWFAPSLNFLSPSMYPVYGVSALVAVLLLYNMQCIVKRTETHPFYSKYPYDPVNNAMLIFLDMANVIRKDERK